MVFDIYEVGQTISMKKRGHFSWVQLGYPKKSGEGKKTCPSLKSYKSRRRAIQRGEVGTQQAKFGNVGCSSWWW